MQNHHHEWFGGVFLTCNGNFIPQQPFRSFIVLLSQSYQDLLEILFNLHFSQVTSALSYFIASPSVLPPGELNVIMCIFRLKKEKRKREASEQQIFQFTVSVTNLYLYGSDLQEEEKCSDFKKKEEVKQKRRTVPYSSCLHYHSLLWIDLLYVKSILKIISVRLK